MTWARYHTDIIQVIHNLKNLAHVQFSIYILRETEYIITIQITIITYSHNSRTPGANLWPWFWFFLGKRWRWRWRRPPPAPTQRRLLPRAYFRGPDPRPEKRIFFLSPYSPRRGDGFEALSLQSLLHGTREPSVVLRLRCCPEDAGGSGTCYRDLLGSVTDDIAVGVRHARGYDLVPPWPYSRHLWSWLLLLYDI